MAVHRFELSVLSRYPTRAAWDADAADTLATMLERWNLTAGEAFTGGEAGVALGVTCSDGSSAVLKVGFPHDEAVAEAVALESWAPRLAPRVLRQDAWTWAMLLERIEPGTPLSRSGMPAPEALSITGTLLRLLHAHPVPDAVPGIREIVGPWLDHARVTIDRVDADRQLVSEVRARLDDAQDLIDFDNGSALLHGDANPGNILLGPDGSWLAIDPKPMRGRAEFDLQPATEQLGRPWDHSDGSAALKSQLAILVDAVGADWEHSVRWARARAALNLAWAWEDGNRPSAALAARALVGWSGVSVS